MKVCIIAEAYNRRILPISFELLTRALALAPGDIGALVVSDGLPEQELNRLVAAGADTVLSYEGDFLGKFRPEPYCRALVDAVERYSPEIIIGGATTSGRTWLPYAAMRLQTGLTADCTELAIDAETGLLLQTRPAIGGNIMATIKTPKHRPQMATIRPHSTPPAPELPGRKGTIEHYAAPSEWAASSIGLLSSSALDEKQELSSARRIVAVGRGIKKPENLAMVRELASLLGAAVGATREIVDRGWLPYSCQIGLSGRTVTPDLYIGLGVSGAIQHLAGMQTAKRIVAVNTKIASAKNQQVLRFKLVTQETGADLIVQNMKLGGLLPELHLPYAGTEPEAFIIICSTIPENKFVDIDLGIAAQSMLLKATEMGLNGIMIGAFNKAKITEAFNLPYEPLLILAIGKGNETIKLQAVDAGDKLAYYRDNDGVQYVPKIRWEQLII